ncbi:MAG TPA: pyruvate kinase [Polyangiaceae bacterium]|nr:pyruvate kinase [Polyangiaceae bacterium]
MTSTFERREFRHTKIICTIGPASDTSAIIEKMASAGMNIARLNMSHGDPESHLMAVRRIKSLNQKLNHPISMLVDLQGPEIRTGELEHALDLKVGETFSLSVRPVTDPEERSVHVDYQSLVQDLKPGNKVTVDNGLINLEVLEVNENRLLCRVIDGGKLGSRKHINLPGIRVNLPSITEKDRRDIQFAITHELDFIALSFVRSPNDVLEARQIVEAGGANIKLIAKIENQEGVANFTEILEVADGIMVARGDLGVEVDFRELPVIQRRIVRDCTRIGKPVIVATHLLESMREAPMPTRAEVTDVANAIYEQADAIMLSGETASGRYPVRCVEVMDGIAKRIEKERGLDFYWDRIPKGARDELARSACRVADSLGAPAIVVITRRGLLGQLVASHRPQRAIIYAFTNMSSVRRKMWLSRSVVPFVIDFSKNPEKTIQTALDKLGQRNRLFPGDQVVVITDVTGATVGVPSVQVRTFGEPPASGVEPEVEPTTERDTEAGP